MTSIQLTKRSLLGGTLGAIGLKPAVLARASNIMLLNATERMVWLQ
jgi:hypothetical protein